MMHADNVGTALADNVDNSFKLARLVLQIYYEMSQATTRYKTAGNDAG